jgi:hypothetical protein
VANRKDVAHGDARPTDDVRCARFTVYYRKEITQAELHPNHYACTIPNDAHVELLVEYVHDYGGLPNVRQANR